MNNFSNIQKMIQLGSPSWDKASSFGLTHIRAKYTETNKLLDNKNHEFINMCSCSYLGLDKHKKIIKGAIDALEAQKVLILPTSRTRIGLSLLDEVEEKVSELFNCEAFLTVSCAAASSGILPLIASGALSNNKKPLMIFDKLAHFSMNHIKSSCGDETEVVTCEHNDLDFIEKQLKLNPDRSVFYIADGAYSMGGYAPVKELQQLQNNYGLYVYYDDSHSISMYGERGVGFVRSQYNELNKRTIIIASLGKAFGATGGVVLIGDSKMRRTIDIFAGPLGWSQTVNVAALGAINASAEIHKTNELKELQHKLAKNMALFDKIIPTVNANNNLPIRVIELPKAEKAISVSKKVFEKGFYTSAVFFPIVSRGKAGLRVMGRADLTEKNIVDFCDIISDSI